MGSRDLGIHVHVEGGPVEAETFLRTGDGLSRGRRQGGGISNAERLIATAGAVPERSVPHRRGGPKASITWPRRCEHEVGFVVASWPKVEPVIRFLSEGSCFSVEELGARARRRPRCWHVRARVVEDEVEAGKAARPDHVARVVVSGRAERQPLQATADPRCAPRSSIGRRYTRRDEPARSKPGRGARCNPSTRPPKGSRCGHDSRSSAEMADGPGRDRRMGKRVSVAEVEFLGGTTASCGYGPAASRSAPLRYAAKEHVLDQLDQARSRACTDRRQAGLAAASSAAAEQRVFVKPLRAAPLDRVVDRPDGVELHVEDAERSPFAP